MNMYSVAIALYPTALASSITLPMEILQAADSMFRAAQRGRSGLQIRLVSDNRETITTSGGVELRPNGSFNDIEDVDMLILPSMWRNPLPTLKSNKHLLPILRTLANRDAKICAVGTASCFLAEAGLLDGRAATTHWYYFDRFQQRYPAVNLKTRHMITQSSNFYCAGSVNSVADLMVHIIQEWFGEPIARGVEGHFSPEIRRPFESHAYLAEGAGSQPDELVISAQEWLMDKSGDAITISDLAVSLNVSLRTLNRRFHVATGLTPLTYLTRHRVHSAREMLRSTDLSIGEVAYIVGYSDASHFARIFTRHTGQTPSDYRRSVRGKLFRADMTTL